ncbi:MAG: hypothetical protein HYS65_10745 [Betaproteobacteria bacterium]|nr:hypothetical protein [Betaproteobacteria bacterium]
MKELAAALRDLHRALTERVRRDYEREHHGLLSPGTFLHLLISDPRLAWIRPLSELMVDLDVFLQADPSPTADEAAAVRTEVERFIAPEPREASESFATFARQYWAYLSDDPQIAMAHARAMQAIQGLPEAASVNEAEVLHERHRWAELRRHRR